MSYERGELSTNYKKRQLSPSYEREQFKTAMKRVQDQIQKTTHIPQTRADIREHAKKGCQQRTT